MIPLQKILAEYEEPCEEFDFEEGRCNSCTSCKENKALEEAIKQYARSIIEQSVPKWGDMKSENPDEWRGFSDCAAQTLSNADNLLK